MATFASLANTLEYTAKRVLQENNQRAIAIAAAILDELLAVTPVDTSQALSNWQITLGAASAQQRLPYYSGSFGSTQTSNTVAARSAGVDVLLNKQPNQSIFISNVLPYIVDLDRGSSKQFAGGFAARAVLVARLVAQGGFKRP
jgi:hypothetical protein